MAYYIENGLSKYKVGSEATKLGRVVSEIYYNAENGFGIYGLEDSEYHTFKVVGTFLLRLKFSHFYQFTGEIVVKNNEKEIQVSDYRQADPVERDGIIGVLRLLPGLDIKANKLYDLCGDQVLSMIKMSPNEVFEKVKGQGFSLNSILEWQKDLLAEEADENALRTILGFGINPKKAKELINVEGLGIADRIKKNPYMLLGLEMGFSFKKVDQIALKAGVALNDIQRLSEVVLYTLRQAAAENGDSCMEKDELIKLSKRTASFSITPVEARRLLKKNCKETLSYRIGGTIITVERKKLKEGAVYDDDIVLFEISDTEIAAAIQVLLTGSKIIEDAGFYQLDIYDHYERTISTKVNFLLAESKPNFSDAEISKVLESVLSLKGGIILESGQEKAIYECCRSRYGIFILTGPAGSGKTFISSIIVDVMKRLLGRASVQCLAPTGKAAKNLSNSVKLPASTIHRFVGKTDRDTLVVAPDIFIIDEFSMVSEEVGAWLFEELPVQSKVIILGDTAQLPSIGAGALLRDFTEFKQIPHHALDVVKRQEKNSGVLINAEKIRVGEKFKTEIVNQTSSKNNAYVKYDSKTKDNLDTLVFLCKQKGLKAFHEDRLQLLIAQKKGASGTNAVNYLIQQAINPWDGGSLRVKTGTSIGDNDLYFQVGDRVIHTKNDYDAKWYFERNGMIIPTGKAGIMNGEMGNITSIEKVQTYNGTVTRITVQYGDEYILYDNDDAFNLLHAYAITIHKSQGSQWKEVISIISKNDSILLNRKLLYTLYTRAQETMFLIADEEAVEQALKDVKPNMRRTLTFLKR